MFVRLKVSDYINIKGCTYSFLEDGHIEQTNETGLWYSTITEHCIY